MDNSDDDKGSESPKSRELSRQIDYQVMVLNEEQSRTEASTFAQTVEPTIVSDVPLNSP